MKKNILIIFGTRPEVIKLAPVINSLKKTDKYNVFVCNSEQQKNISTQIMHYFGITSDFNLNIMKNNQSLEYVQSKLLILLSDLYKNNRFDATIVQGDTMTAFCGALASFYNKVPVFYVESGLRSYDLFEPFPEEAIRQMISRISDLNFVPTTRAYNALVKENIDKNKIILTGNTVIDSLNSISTEIINNAALSLQSFGVKFNQKMVLITVHRRENHGKRLLSIISAIKYLSNKYPDHQFIIPVHPNPKVHDIMYSELSVLDNILLTSPLDYPELVCLLQNTKIILTDSGGIQEEAPSYGNPILILRHETERPEGIESGFAKLIGTDKKNIIKEASFLLDKDKKDISLNCKKNPYGSGNASIKICESIDLFFKKGQ